ncbi:NAD-dependent epimerase/dehydratase family protein [Shimia abyssi]|uniref:UDP-glucose 4-epimerase n=1 Tax=Shimia abyssi TaxID=1662395 RepID=A0A2P8FBV5_9RHOB|nr:NAD(P)-dependent oxidoreductase [Shimia abyssi]PSL19178.1 UDP-glucose 4-epimerase [Shimia abyssi]
MNGPIVVTGAAGFIGKHTVTYAVAEGLQVRAVVRSDAGLDGAEVFRADIGTDDLSNAFAGAGAVIHAAATLAGDHARDTVAASHAVVAAVAAAEVKHMVLVSSLAVYDVETLKDHDTLDESCPLAARGRDAYSAAKLEQEAIFQTGAEQHGFTLTILRPGAVYGPGRLFNAHIGPGLGPVLAMIDGGGKVPLCRVDLLAACLVRAALAPNGVEVINIFDDALPDRDHFLSAFRETGWPKLALHVPLGLARLAVRITPNGPRMPGLFNRSTLEARHKPLRYANARMHNRLQPVTMMPFAEAMERAIEMERGQTT